MQLTVITLVVCFATAFGYGIQRRAKGHKDDSSVEDSSEEVFKVDEPELVTSDPPTYGGDVRTRALLTRLLAVASIDKRSTGCNLTPAERDEILQEHNHYRSILNPAALNLQPLQWSNELATVAQNYADQCIWRHNSARSSQSQTYSYVGENLFITTGNTGYLKHSVYRWDAENNDYNYASNSCTPGRVCGHYTQVVWAGSTHVGCAVTNCPSVQNLDSRFDNSYIVVCNYGPGGNYIGQKPYVAA